MESVAATLVAATAPVKVDPAVACITPLIIPGQVKESAILILL
jgi:hypothetical protein